MSADETADAVVLPVGRFGDLGRRRALLPAQEFEDDCLLGAAAYFSLRPGRFGLGTFRCRRELCIENRPTIESMNISKADAIAHLAKWFDAGTQVRATYRTITGNSFIIGKIEDLSPAAIKVTGNGCEMLLYLRTTSEYDYKDARDPAGETNKERENKYPTVIFFM